MSGPAVADLDVVDAARGDSEAGTTAHVRVSCCPGVLGLALGLVYVEVMHQHNIILGLQQPVAAPLQSRGLLHAWQPLFSHGHDTQEGLPQDTAGHVAVLCACGT